MLVEYSSNNSGGNWWLSDEDWSALEKAGWKVDWVKDEPAILSSLSKDGRWLGARATRASKECPSLKEAILEFERITGQDASDEGCNCCGPPHSFSAENEYASGEDILQVLYPNSPRTLREAIEEERCW